MKRILFYLITLIFLAACQSEEQPTVAPTANIPAPTPTLAQAAPTTAVQPTETAVPPAVPPTEPVPTTAVLPTMTAVSESDPVILVGPEAIQINEPAPGWRLTSPILVAGVADPTFEQNLVVRLLLEDGTELALIPTTIAADTGQRGPFVLEVPFTVSGERQAFLQVYATSARDGGITHLSSVGITIADSGPENRPPTTPMNERIMIAQPTLNAVVSGGTVHVEGVALASFEATLVVEILDESGTVIGSQPILVQSPDLGLPGPFSADIPYSGSPTGPGRVVIRDLSPAFGGDVHVASVEIQFE